MTAVCPVCFASQPEGLLCHDDTTRLEKALGQVPALVADLDVALTKTARINGGGKSGLPSERTPVGWNAVDPRWVLENVLTTWARDVADVGFLAEHSTSPTRAAARILLNHVNQIRRHPAVDELVDEILDSIRQARRAIDRPADKQYLGQCLVPSPDEEGRPVTCLAEVYARHGASQATCGTCGITHDTFERRAKMLHDIEGMIFTVRDASYVLGEIGEIRVSQASIRGYIHRGKLAYRPGVVHGIRLGDLLTVVLDEGERRSA